LPADDDELLAEDQIFGDQGCPGRDEGQDDVEQETKESNHGSEAPTTTACSWHGPDLAPRRPRHPRKDQASSRAPTEYLRPTTRRDVLFWG
jgi:hypothetical protein